MMQKSLSSILIIKRKGQNWMVGIFLRLSETRWSARGQLTFFRPTIALFLSLFSGMFRKKNIREFRQKNIEWIFNFLKVNPKTDFIKLLVILTFFLVYSSWSMANICRDMKFLKNYFETFWRNFPRLFFGMFRKMKIGIGLKFKYVTMLTNDIWLISILKKVMGTKLVPTGYWPVTLGYLP